MWNLNPTFTANSQQLTLDGRLGPGLAHGLWTGNQFHPRGQKLFNHMSRTYGSCHFRSNSYSQAQLGIQLSWFVGLI